MIKLFKQIGSILSKRDRVKLVIIFIIILGSAILDLVGVSAILPIISLLTTGEEAIETNYILRIASNLFNTKDVNSLSIILLVSLCIFYLFKTSYMIMHTYAMSRFSLSNSRRLTKRLMEVYLSFPYEFHLNNNSSTLIRKSTYDVENFTNAINSLLSFFSKSLTAIAIVVYLFITDYRITLIVGGILLVFSFVVIVVLKPAIKRIAKRAQGLNSNNFKFLSQAFHGIKESKICNITWLFNRIV